MCGGRNFLIRPTRFSLSHSFISVLLRAEKAPLSSFQAIHKLNHTLENTRIIEGAKRDHSETDPFYILHRPKVIMEL